MCRRLVINSGLEKVVIRRTETEFEVVNVRDWVWEDDQMAAGIQKAEMDLK